MEEYCEKLSKLTPDQFYKLIMTVCSAYLNHADAVPVVHGRWVDLGFVGDKHYSGCDICHSMEEKKTPHCPSCGARMDGEEAQQ